MNKKRILRSVIASTAAAAVVGLGMYVPAQAATRSTVIVIESNTMTALNCNTPATNLVINCDISYLTNMGFQHYDDNKKLVRNKIFGSYKIVKNTNTCLDQNLFSVCIYPELYPKARALPNHL